MLWIFLIEKGFVPWFCSKRTWNQGGDGSEGLLLPASPWPAPGRPVPAASLQPFLSAM